MYTYEFICNQDGNKITMEIHDKLDYNLHCPCGHKMEMILFIKTPDVRAE